MREILFRGKSIDSGAWVYGNLLQYADTTQIWYGTDNGKWNCLVDPATVGQYTGRDDCNGVKLFEGDIVKWTVADEQFVGVIGYADQVFGVSIVPTNKGGLFLCVIPELTKIGNIWDDPELLEGMKE